MFFSLSPYFSWFHGRIKREEAESLLKPREDGLFLVRESTNFPGDYTLCVCFNEKVEHYRIKYVDNKLTIDDDEYFDHLGQLVEVCCTAKIGVTKLCIINAEFDFLLLLAALHARLGRFVHKADESSAQGRILRKGLPGQWLGDQDGGSAAEGKHRQG